MVMLVPVASASAAPDGKGGGVKGGMRMGSNSGMTFGGFVPTQSSKTQLNRCHHPQGPGPGDDRVPVTPVPPPGVIVDPVRPVVTPDVRDHRRSVPPVVRDHRTVQVPDVRDHRVQSGARISVPPVVPSANDPWRGGNAPGGVSVTSAPSRVQNGGVETISGAGTLETIGAGLSTIGSGIVDFFTPDLGEVPPNRDHRTSSGTAGNTTRDHRN